MKKDQMPSLLDTWYQARDEAPRDADSGISQVMTQVPQVRQRSRWWPFPIFYRRTVTPTTTDTIEYQFSPSSATNGQSATVTGRTQSMFSPVKAITAGALVFAIGGVLLLAQPFQQQSSVPGAEATVPPVEVTGTDVEGICPGGPSTMDGLIEKNRGYVCQHTWSMSDPRLEGTFTRAWNLDFYHDGTGLDFGYATGRLETTDGAWQQRPGLRGGIAGEPDPSDVVELFVFDGEDDYEGLIAVVLKVNREDGVEVDPARLHGYIVDADFPPSDHLPSE